MSILIYQDYIHNTDGLYRSLSLYFGRDNIRYCDADDILSGILNADVELLVMPGGADLYYCEKLNSKGNRLIRAYVDQGGSYLGICAGAYYGCASLSWAKGKAQEITGKRELAFYNGQASGPVYQYIENGNINHSWLGASLLAYDDREMQALVKVCYGGGPVFEEPDPLKRGPKARVLARYADLPDRPPAILEIKIGRGRAILCSPHLERTAEYCTRALYQYKNPSYDWDKRVADKLAGEGSEISRVWTALLKRAVAKNENRERQIA